MTVKEAYQTLGIKEGSSEQEAKKAYRSIARKLHPDNYPDNSVRATFEEKMKTISAAYDLVKNNLKNPARALEEELKDAKCKNIYILNKFRNYQNFLGIPEEYKESINAINTLIEDSIYIISIATGITMIKVTLNSTYEKIKLKYEGIAKDYFGKANLDDSFLQELNYRVDIKTFFKNLEKIKLREERRVLAFKAIDDLASNYLDDPENSALKENIRQEVETIKKRCIANDYKETKDLLALLNEKLLNLIDMYKMVLIKLEQLTNYFMRKYDEYIFDIYQYGMSFRDLRIIVELNHFRSNLKGEINIGELYHKIVKLERQIVPQEVVYPSSEEVLNIYHKISNQAIAILGNTKEKMSCEQLDDMAKILAKAMEISRRALDGMISANDLVMLNDLSFANLRESAFILEQFDIDIDKLYVRKKPNSALDGMIYVALEDEKELYMVDYRNDLGKVKLKVSLKQLSRDFISLREFLDSIKFIGQNVNRIGTSEVVLYSWDYILNYDEYNKALDKSQKLKECGIEEKAIDIYSYYVILKENGEIRIVPKFKSYSESLCIEAQEYQDKKVLLEEIIREITENKLQKRA